MMKKNLLYLFMLLSLSAFSQSLSVNPDSYYYSLASETCTAHFDVTNLTNQDLSVIVTRNMDPAYNITSTFCWGETCYTPTTSVSTNPIVISAGESSDQFSGYIYGMPEESSFMINYCFSLENNPTDKVCTDVTYTSLSSGMNLEQLSTDYNVYPNPVKDLLFIDYNVSTPAEFILYDMLGSKVYKDVLTSSMTLNFSSFEAGIYFYTFSIQGKETEVQKLIITH